MKRQGNVDVDDVEGLLTEFARGSAGTSFASEPGLQQALRATRALSASRTDGTPLSEGSEPCRNPQPGDWFGQYRIVEQLGEGGMGIVYLARHGSLGKLFAIKLVRDRRLDDPQAIARFEREMRLLGQIEHRNVVSATDGGRIRDIRYMVMNYVEGIDAGTLVGKLGPQPVSAACEIIGQAATGLQALHAQDLVHRDIKPSNLLVGFDCVTRVADFGLARVADPTGELAVTSDGQTVGTVAYMSPEQFNGAELGPTADLYSLGATLYFLLCGLPPSQCAIQNPLAAVGARTLPRAIPDAVRGILQQLLASEPQQRIHSAAEVADRLAEFADPQALATVVDQLRPSGSATAGARSLRGEPDAAASSNVTSEAKAAPESGSHSKPLAAAPAERREARWRYFGLMAILAIVGLPLVIVVIRTRGAGPSPFTADAAGAGAVAQDVHEPAASPSAPPSLEPGAESERGLAKWAVERGGHLLLWPTKHVHALEDLPDDDFLVLNMSLRDAGIHDEDVSRVAKLSALQNLDLSENRLTSDSLIHLASLDKLKWLYMSWNEIDDRGVEALLPHGDTLRSLGLSGTNVSTSGIEQLVGFSVLRELLISDTEVDDEVLVGLERFPELMRLDVARTGITDAGLEHLQTCPHLRFLILDDTSISDEAVPQLLALEQIEELKIRGTLISQEGHRRLAEGLPNCTIQW